MTRPDGRGAADLRPLALERGSNPYAEGSCLVRMGGTLVLCTASVEDGVPGWRRGSGLGWVTAEYAMLPRATTERTPRERQGAGGRTQEIQRLIGRSVRAALTGFDFGEHTIRLDCDVLQADGGTRTAAVTGAAVALSDACAWLVAQKGVKDPFARLVAAVKELHVSLPIVIRMEGTNVDTGKRMLRDSGLNFTTADAVDQAASAVVTLAGGR